jgi:hypothetical protein
MNVAIGRPDLGVAIFARDEAHRMHRTIVSVNRALAVLNGLGVAADVVVIHCGRCEKTRAWLAQKCSFRVAHLDEACLGEARNHARQLLKNRFLAFIDGGDLWSGNFLVDALSRATRYRHQAVWRPAFSVSFADQYFETDLLERRDTPWPDMLNPATLLIEPLFPPTFLAARSVLEIVPFPVEDLERGWTEIDWWWSANLAGGRIEQIPVAQSIHYHRATVRQPKRGRIGPTSLSRAIGSEKQQATPRFELPRQDGERPEPQII